MINILSYVGMNMQSEVCLWTLLGLLRTIFDATLFKVNANLKQVWQMSMPAELSMPVQRVLRTMISGVMLVQCFTVYVYLASYIVLLYPVFLEERPTLVLPWLLLAAVRKLLCELTSLALGLGTCVLLGPAKPPCIRFLIVKISTIMPAFYMWLLMYSYYHVLKVSAAFKTFPAVLPPNDLDYGLELAVRRRRTKSLFGEDQLRKKLVSGFYADACNNKISPRTKLDATELQIPESSVISNEEVPLDMDTLRPLSMVSNKYTDIGGYEDFVGNEIIIPRGDRIIEQFIVMLLRIGAYLQRDGSGSMSQMFYTSVTSTWPLGQNMSSIPTDVTDTPPLVANSKGRTASYLRDYPQIFMKKLSLSSEAAQLDRKISQVKQRHVLKQSSNSSRSSKSSEIMSFEIDRDLPKTEDFSNQKSSKASVNDSEVENLKDISRRDLQLLINDIIAQALNWLSFSEQEELQRKYSVGSIKELIKLKESSKSVDQVSHKLALPEQKREIENLRSDTHVLSEELNLHELNKIDSAELNNKSVHSAGSNNEKK